MKQRQIPEGMFADEPRKHFVTDGTITLDTGKERPIYFVFCRPCGHMYGYINVESARIRLDVHKSQCVDSDNNLTERMRQTRISKLLEARERISRELQELDYDEN